MSGAVGSLSWNSGGTASEVSTGDGDRATISGSTLLALDGLRKKKVLCDVTLVSNEGVEFKGHKAVFAAASSFFRGLFTHDGKYSHPENSCAEEDFGKGEGGTEEFEVEADSDLLEMIVDFAYTGTVSSLGFLQVERLLPLADRLNMSGLVDVCARFLQDRIEPANCVGIWEFARFYFCHPLETAALKSILYHVRRLVFDGESTEFFGTTPEELRIILDHDLLNLNGEEEVTEILTRWVRFDLSVRSLALPSLLSTLRHGLCSRLFIFDNLPAWAQRIGLSDSKHGRETLKRIQEEWSAAEDSGKRSPRLNDKIPQDVLFSLGGWTDGSPTRAIETYDPKADRWFPVNSGEANPRAYHGLAVHEQRIYVVGGFDGTDYYNSVRIFDAGSRVWKEAAPMYVARCYVSVVVLEGMIYAIGGFDGRVRLASAEKYDPDSNQWTLVAPMNRRRSDSSAATLNDRIFVAGGFNGQEVLSSVEVYNPTLDHWIVVADLLSPRSGVSIAVQKDQVFAVGGFDGTSRLRSVERYDSENFCWVYCSPLCTPRSNFALCNLGGSLYAIGGFNGLTTIAGVERMDENGEWSVVSEMAINRSAVKACVVTGLEDTRVYGFHGHAKHP